MSADNGVYCLAGHRFDRARQGYLNLLPVQHKRSRAPGDNRAMVEARRRFLDAGHYAPLVKRLVELFAARKPARWLDIGCGEGYYSAQLAEALPDADAYALDISREAIRRACRRAPQVNWLVASMSRVPLASDNCQLLTSVFSPIDWQEAFRLLEPGGGLLRMGPCSDHLLELRSRLYDDVRTYDDSKHLERVPADMQLAHSEILRYRLALNDVEAREDLLAMTPHGWRAGADRRHAVISAPLMVTVAVRYDWIVKIE